MLAILSILAIGLAVAFILILSVSVLSSQITSMESEYTFDESVLSDQELG